MQNKLVRRFLWTLGLRLTGLVTIVSIIFLPRFPNHWCPTWDCEVGRGCDRACKICGDTRVQATVLSRHPHNTKSRFFRLTALTREEGEINPQMFFWMCLTKAKFKLTLLPVSGAVASVVAPSTVVGSSPGNGGARPATNFTPQSHSITALTCYIGDRDEEFRGSCWVRRIVSKINHSPNFSGTCSLFSGSFF